VSTRIERIENAGPDPRARRIVFSDGSEPRVTSAAALKAICLDVESEVDPTALEDSLAQIELPLAKERALALLGYRERSAREVIRKLQDNGYPQHVAQAVVERFCEVDIIDDARFAAAWSRSRLSAGYGERRIARELAERGVDPDTASAALAEAIGDTDPLSRARDSLGNRRARDQRERQKLVRKLVARGFDLSVALAAVEIDPGAGDV
jgi:regulatory protein